MTKIHPSSVISDEAEIGPDVEIGPNCLIQGKVKIGRGTRLEGQASIGCRSAVIEIGENNHFSPCSVIGGPPQDLSYKGEPTRLVIGDNNIFREFTTVNLATSKGEGITRVGSNCYFMSYTHVGHDCQVGNNVTVANNTHIGGHCDIEDFVVLGGMCALNQFTKVGKGSFLGGGSIVNKDILPFSRAQGNWARVRATNKVGLLRRGYSREDVTNIHKAIRIIIFGAHTIDEGLERIRNECAPSESIDYMIKFIKSSKRGIAISRNAAGDDE